MSLMNDALRKKNREIAGSPAVSGFSKISQSPRTTRKGFSVIAAMILLTAAALTGIHLMQSASGNTLRVKRAQPSDAQLPVNRAVDTPSSAGRQAEVTPTFGPVDGNPEPLKPADTPQEKRATAADRQPLPASSVSDGPKPGTRHSRSAPVEARVDRKPPATAIAKASAPITERNTGGAVRKNGPSHANRDLFYKKALAYHRSGRLLEAIRLYRQVLKSDSSHPGAMLNLAAAAMRQGNYHEAQTLLERLEPSTRRPQGVLFNLAIAAIGMGAPETALDYLDNAQAVSDASPWEIRFHRAVAYTHMNQPSEALVLYRQVQTERPNAPGLQFNLAVTCDALGLYPEALAYYEAAMGTPLEPSGIDKETITQRIRTIGQYLGNTQASAKRQ